MELKLAENIRAFRKQRRLTQEQFAEVLSVTAGAVYKWEAGLSVPDISLIMEMADFFDTSVDVLLGYEIRDNRLETMKERLVELVRTGNPDVLNEAEKALKKYPNSFDIVHGAALIYLIFASQNRNKERLRRSLELYEQALRLLPQNTDPTVSEATIYGEMGQAYIQLGEQEKGLEILKKHNPNEVYNDTIGTVMATFLHKTDEAEPFLNSALFISVATLVNVVTGYAFVYSARGDFNREREILQWGESILHGMKAAETSSILEKMQAMLQTLLAHALNRERKRDEAYAALRRSAEHIRRFDEAPNFGVGAVRFGDNSDVSLYDGFGLTAEESVSSLIELLDDEAFTAMWKEIMADQQDRNDTQEVDLC